MTRNSFWKLWTPPSGAIFHTESQFVPSLLVGKFVRAISDEPPITNQGKLHILWHRHKIVILKELFKFINFMIVSFFERLTPSIRLRKTSAILGSVSILNLLASSSPSKVSSKGTPNTRKQ